MSEFTELKAAIQQHCGHISRLRIMILIGIAAVFTWVLLGGRKRG